MPHTDIRKFMPQTPQTDRDKFPDYEYKPYPRMMTHEAGGKYVPYKNPDGTPVIVHSETEEAAFLAKHGHNVKEAAKPAVTAIEQVVAEPERKKPGRPPKPAHVNTKLPDDLT